MGGEHPVFHSPEKYAIESAKFYCRNYSVIKALERYKGPIQDNYNPVHCILIIIQLNQIFRYN